MAVSQLISLEAYLTTSWRPDCDYIDGEVQERNVGERDHSRAQREILIWLSSRYPELRNRLFPEQRVQVSASRFRIPDVCLAADGAPDEPVFRTPPALCIEILSKDDRMTEILGRIHDYFQMGVPTCWIIDPLSRTGWAANPGQLESAQDGILRAGRIEMPLAEIL